LSKIILLAPPYLDLYGKISKAAGRYFPLGIAYIAAYLRKYGGHDVEMYEPEAQGLTYDSIQKIIRKANPDVVGITSATPNFPRAAKLGRMCREISPSIKIVLGGVHASAIPEFIVESYPDCFDCVVVGEGEETMLELVDAWRDGKDLAGIPGLVYREGGKAVRTGQRPYIDDLDKIPNPARDLIPQHLFVPNAHNARFHRCLTILTSRGCPFNCSFCAARIVSGSRYRTHSPEYVLSEMEMLKKDYGAQQLLITDDTFTINRERLEAICEGMVRRKLNLQWFCFSQVNTIDREALTLMKRAGCYNIGFGVESADEGILKQMGKNIKPEQAIKTVGIANEVGMKTQAFYIFGMPGETREQIQKTIDLSFKVNSTLAFFNMLVPYPGTRDFEYFFKDIPLEEIRWEDFVAIGENCVLAKNPAVSKEELEHFIAKASTQYYKDPRRLFNIAKHIRTPYEFMNYMSGGLSFARQIGSWLSKKTKVAS
jgi:anaerobic magnesium-protoporphyrin IX monomethyl ester cyclase